MGEPGEYPDRQACTECGDDFSEIDEATELCEACFEHVFGEPNPEHQP